MFGRIGATEIIVVLVVLLILFGGKKLPEFARGLAESLNIFKSASKGLGDDKDNKTKES